MPLNNVERILNESDAIKNGGEDKIVNTMPFLKQHSKNMN